LGSYTGAVLGSSTAILLALPPAKAATVTAAGGCVGGVAGAAEYQG